MFLPNSKYLSVKQVRDIKEARKLLISHRDSYNLEFKRVGFILALGYNERSDYNVLNVPITQAKKFYNLKHVLIAGLNKNINLYTVYSTIHKKLRNIKLLYWSYKNIINGKNDPLYNIIVLFYAKWSSKTVKRQIGYKKIWSIIKNFHLTPIIYNILSDGSEVWDWKVIEYLKTQRSLIKTLLNRLNGIIKKIKPQDLCKVENIDLLIYQVIQKKRTTHNFIYLIQQWLDQYNISESTYRFELIELLYKFYQYTIEEYNCWLD